MSNGQSNGPLQSRIQQARTSDTAPADEGYSPDSAKFNPDRSTRNRTARAPMKIATTDERVERILRRINSQLRPMLKEAIETRAFGKVVSETLFQNGKEKSGDARYNRTFLYDDDSDE